MDLAAAAQVAVVDPAVDQVALVELVGESAHLCHCQQPKQTTANVSFLPLQYCR